MDLLEELTKKAQIWLTEKQFQIFNLYYVEHKKQGEVAAVVGVNQSSIHKALNGAAVYQDGERIRLGGVIPKLKKKAAVDPEIKQILTAIADQIEKENF